MYRKKVARSRSDYMENSTDGIGLIARSQPIANAAHSSSTPQLMLQRKCSVNVNHLHSCFHTQGSVPSVPSVMLNLFHSEHVDPSRTSHLLKPNPEHMSPDTERLGSYFPVHTTSLDQFIFSLVSAEMSKDSNQTKYCYSDSSTDQNLYPASHAEKTTDTKLLDISMSGVRSAERSIELNLLHSYHSHPIASQSLSVRSAERSIESNVLHLHTYHPDPSAYQLTSVRSPERSLESSESQNSELLNIKASTQVTNFSLSMSDVRPAERSIELNQLYSYQFCPSASKLHNACLSQGSIGSKVLESNYLVQKGEFDLSISCMRSAERSLVLVN